MEERLQTGTNKWREGLFKERSVDSDGEQQMPDQRWRSDASAKWDMIATGKWMQKAAWNRWVTKLERDQSHKTPITSTWTVDFLTREEKDPSDECGCFPIRGSSAEMGQAADGICELCKRYREMVRKLLGGRPARVTTGHLQSSVCRLQSPTATGAHNAYFQRVQDDMSKTRSVWRDWEFVSKGTEISLGTFVSEHFTPLTLDLQTRVVDLQTRVVSTEDTDEIWEAGGEVFLAQQARRLGDRKKKQWQMTAKTSSEATLRNFSLSDKDETTLLVAKWHVRVIR
jgi:hypothetical protein